MNVPVTKADSERKLSPAARTRLRGGKLLDLEENLISECTLYDLENGNVGIVVSNPEIEISDTLYLQDNKDLMIVLAQIQWRMGPNLGIAYLEQPIPLSIWGQSRQSKTDN
ncbi:MAG: hypothetical protein ABJY83_24000 [Roseibium sp.]